jgi:UDPglucose 6-dehydrogenase
VQALIHSAAEHQLDFTMLKETDEVNDRQKRLMLERVKQHFGPDLSGFTFAIWGLAFKPRTDDMREAPSLVVIDELLKAQARGAGARSRSLGGREADLWRADELPSNKL